MENDVNIATHYGAIDIGSNAVRLLIKRVEEENGEPVFSKVLLFRVPLRLGFDVFSKGKISDKREEDMTNLMQSYRYLMKIYDVKDYRACATSAMREAKNGIKVIKRIEKKTGIRIEIIDGQEEAHTVYNNHIEYMGNCVGNYMYVDVGGGSTEINLLSQGKLVCSRSFNIGTIRILKQAVEDGEWERLKQDVEELAKSYPNTDIIGSGGNVNKYYKLADKKDKKKQSITVEVFRHLYESLKGLSVEERMENFNLKPDRADVIVPAGEIFLTIADILKANLIYVPVFGLSDGIIDSLYLRDKGKKKNPQV